ncbi:hypothetical protein I6F53_09450 [Pseudoalteromonas sp. SWN29]|uniref:hypothetical protein n=1 Tax=Pseudoalteromonas sp. SWN29 TaxID=2792064 RepID=UPI0018CE0556|nr:hypothetical protein [Pseudoalteromonas sp. SWN29]MBH0027214.1 hypothetical protein [Pseudoalteromonas sp. SWN29]
MNWNQFGYICRVNSSKTLSAEKKDELSTPPYLDVYINNGVRSKLADDLISKIASQDEATSQKKATYYQCLPELINEFKFEHKGWLSYLTIVFVIYFLSSLLYQFFVVPAFVEIYSTHTVSLNHTFDDYFTYWYVPIILLTLLLSVIFTIILKLKNASALTELQPFSGLFKILIPRQLINQYNSLTTTLLFPITIKEGIEASTPQTQHLAICELLGLETQEEFKVLLKQQLKLLNTHIKSYISKLVIVYGLVIVVSIYLFVKAAYQPLFMLGEAL